MVVVLALTLTVLGCACIYLASPNQKWRSQPLFRTALWRASSLLLAAGLAAWIAALRPLSGFVVALHVAMVCLCAFPCIGALRAARRRT